MVNFNDFRGKNHKDGKCEYLRQLKLVHYEYLCLERTFKEHFFHFTRSTVAEWKNLKAHYCQFHREFDIDSLNIEKYRHLKYTNDFDMWVNHSHLLDLSQLKRGEIWSNSKFQKIKFFDAVAFVMLVRDEPEEENEQARDSRKG